MRKPSATASAADEYAPDLNNWFNARLGAGGSSTVMIELSALAR